MPTSVGRKFFDGSGIPCSGKRRIGVAWRSVGEDLVPSSLKLQKVACRHHVRELLYRSCSLVPPLCPVDSLVQGWVPACGITLGTTSPHRRCYERCFFFFVFVAPSPRIGSKQCGGGLSCRGVVYSTSAKKCTPLPFNSRSRSHALLNLET